MKRCCLTCRSGGHDSATNLEAWWLSFTICLSYGDKYSAELKYFGLLYSSLFQFLCQLTAHLNLRGWRIIKDFLLLGEPERGVKFSVESYGTYSCNCLLQTITWCYFVLFFHLSGNEQGLIFWSQILQLKAGIYLSHWCSWRITFHRQHCSLFLNQKWWLP